MGTFRSRRPPEGFVAVTVTRWLELCQRVGASPRKLTIELEGALLGWRTTGLQYVEPRAYRRAMGTWPDGFWPDFD